MPRRACKVPLRLADRIAARYLQMKKALNLLIRDEPYYHWRDYTYADEKPEDSDVR